MQSAEQQKVGSAPDQGNTRSLQLEHVNTCRLCDTDEWIQPIAAGTDFEYESTPETFVAKRCANCGLVFLDPRPAMSELATIYGPEYHAYEFSEENFGLAYRVRSWLETRRLRNWCGDLPAGARIIDIGAGDGFHLDLLKKLSAGKWRLEGVDPNQHAVAAARAKGLQMHHGLLEDLELPRDSFDFATMIMTIEHVDAPDRMLENIARLLKPGGRIGIITDNTGSPDFAIAKGRHWGGYHFPRHWNLFNKGSIAKLARKSGLEVVRVRTLVSPVNWTYTVHNWLKDKGAPKFLYSQFKLDKPLPLAFFTLVDACLAMIGRGAILGVVLQKPEQSQQSQ